MKKIATSTIIFLGLLVLLFVVRVLSTDRVNAQKSIRFHLKQFVSDDTNVLIFYVSGDNIIKQHQPEYGKGFVEILSHTLYRYVTKKEYESNKLSNEMNDYIRIKLENGESKYTIDFPATEPEYSYAVITDTVYLNSYVFFLSSRGQKKFKFILRE